MSRLSVEQWRRLVFASQKLEAAPKVLCLYLADHMSPRDRKVSIPRDRIALALGINENRVSDRFKQAVAAGFLSRVSRGFNGRTAVYQAIRPSSDRDNRALPTRKDTVKPVATKTGRTDPIHRWTERESGAQHSVLPVANTEADLITRGSGRDVGTYDKHLDRPAAYSLTVCDCHGFADCASLSDHDREESA